MMDKLKGRPYYILIAVLFMFALLLIGLSGRKDGDQADSTKTYGFDESDYEKTLEARLGELIEKIDGVGNVNVMITLEGSAQYTYAQNTSEDVDRDGDVKKEVSIVLSNKKSNVKEAIVSGYTLPEIKGAAVVCEKKLSADLLKKVIGTVSASLGISTDKIYVTN